MLYYLKGMCCIVASLSLHTGLFAKTKPVEVGFCYCFFCPCCSTKILGFS